MQHKEFEINGKDLLGLSYEQLIPISTGIVDHKFQILDGTCFVTAEDGTGILHVAPGFGEEDYEICKKNNIPVFCPVDGAGCSTIADEIDFKIGDREEKLSLKGKQVFETNDDIIKYLKSQNLWAQTEQYFHNYPHCWRTDTPLIYRAISSWYVKVTDFKDRMVELNKQINWIPEHIKEGQMGKWLENARDWSISRNRFWGCPVPVWKSDNPNNKKLYVFGSIKEIEEFFETKVEDLHRPFIDTLVKEVKDENGNVIETIRRVEDVLDCWFESGSMPFASVHYPFENKEYFEKNFPADFITEYIGQTRGWFYTLIVLATALFDKIPFKNVICHGIVLDEKSQKLSKRLRNYPDPIEIFDKYGSDAMRWTLLKSNIMNGGNFNIDKNGDIILDSVKNVLNPIWNAAQFFVTYAEIDNVKIEKDYEFSKNKMDEYILTKFNQFARNYDMNMENYKIADACSNVERFVEDLNNWYIRRNKDRFWKSESDKDKKDAYQTLFYILKNFSIAISPLLPFLTEKIYEKLQKFEG